MAKEGESEMDRPTRLRSVAHDIANLAYRLTFLGQNLRELVPDASRRDEAIALLDDTASGLQRAAETLRSIDRDE